MSTQAQHTGVAMLLWSADLDHPQRAATPLVMAQAAAALDQAVEIYFTAQAVRLLDARLAGTLIGFGAERLSLDEHLRRTQAAGVRLLACSQAMQGMGLGRGDLHACCAGQGGAVQFMARCADPLWRTLVF